MSPDARFTTPSSQLSALRSSGTSYVTVRYSAEHNTPCSYLSRLARLTFVGLYHIVIIGGDNGRYVTAQNIAHGQAISLFTY